jgi:hypothetical protein
MNDPSLFDLCAPQPGTPQQCGSCTASVAATMDDMRVRGWIAYDGTSLTGQALAVRICPACRRNEGSSHDAASDRLGDLPQVHPHLPGLDR